MTPISVKENNTTSVKENSTTTSDVKDDNTTKSVKNTTGKKTNGLIEFKKQFKNIIQQPDQLAACEGCRLFVGSEEVEYTQHYPCILLFIVFI